MKAGEEITRENLRSIRPGHGLPVKELDRVLGCKSAVPIEKGMWMP
jgi:hypothetical protein